MTDLIDLMKKYEKEESERTLELIRKHFNYTLPVTKEKEENGSKEETSESITIHLVDAVDTYSDSDSPRDTITDDPETVEVRYDRSYLVDPIDLARYKMISELQSDPELYEFVKIYLNNKQSKELVQEYQDEIDRLYSENMKLRAKVKKLKKKKSVQVDKFCQFLNTAYDEMMTDSDIDYDKYSEWEIDEDPEFDPSTYGLKDCE